MPLRNPMPAASIFEAPCFNFAVAILLVALQIVSVQADASNGVQANYTAIVPTTDPDVNTVADSIHYVAFASQWISIPGSLFIIGFTIYHRDAIAKKGPAHRFPLYISIADLGFTITHFSDHMVVLTTGHYPKHDACQFFGWIFQFMSVATIMCVMCVSLYCCYTVWFLKRPDMGKYDWKLIAFGYGVPFVFSFIPFITNSYGHDAAWCWIDQEKPNSHLGYIVIPYLFFLVCNICTLLIIFYCLATSSMNTKTNMVKRSVLFVLAYIFQFTPIIVFSIQVYKGVNVPYDTTLFVVFNTNLGGFLNVIVYGFGILNIGSSGGGAKHNTTHEHTNAGSTLDYKTSQMEQGRSHENELDIKKLASPRQSMVKSNQTKLPLARTNSNSSESVQPLASPVKTVAIRIPHPQSFTSNSSCTPSAAVCPAPSPSLTRLARSPIRVHSTPDTAIELLQIVHQHRSLHDDTHRSSNSASQVLSTDDTVRPDSTPPSTANSFSD